MTPPENHGQGHSAEGPAGSPAVSLCVLARRADFLKAASARRQGTNGFLLQARDRADGTIGARVGFTASKKIGNAILRNRAKRRLRSLAREVLAGQARPGWDYVLVARPEATVSRPYADLRADLEQALMSVHRGRA
jgi:ribonuclease P protein component